ncbi:lens fiber membrane intrinsic protein-like isoform X2 [Pecten maximus]|uniref:lens fiber membrane intrinsic protein-like isoform X2 n=1 Tax=Pecten maximus TaxID=6579 RepID=UPI0014583D8F|nr:lens fiber membrane intrinsic protein-like isoform X2 [Pecten maximus]
MGLGDTPLLFKIALGCGIAGFLFHLVGLATPYWTSITIAGGTIFEVDVHTGLWRGCSGNVCGTVSNPASWLEAAQAFAILGFLAGLAAIVLAILYVFVEQLRKDIFYIVAAVGNLAAAGCIFLAVVIFGSKITNGLSWSFGLSIVGMIFHGVAGVLMGVNRFQNKPQ